MRSSGAVLRRVICALVVVPWVVWAIVRTLSLDGGHPLVAAVAFTPYAAALSVLSVFVAAVLGQRVGAAIAAVAAVALVAAVAPRAIEGTGVADADARGTPFVAMTLNLHNGEADAREVMRLVRRYRVDVLSLQELTPQALRRLNAAGARTLLPRQLVRPGPNADGSGLLARRRLRSTGSVVAIGRRAPAASLRIGRRRLLVAAVHLLAPDSAAGARVWRRQLRALPGPERRGVPRVLLGDFNATLDHRELRRVLRRGYRDAADATGDGLRPTWPVGRAAPPITIDHILLAAPVLIRRLHVLALPRSDHRALIAELLLKK
jgi:endonuclease/exonuclease/phosphatase family metal-dependent hydrolase